MPQAGHAILFGSEVRFFAALAFSFPELIKCAMASPFFCEFDFFRVFLLQGTE
jgi:hypothetical protein